MSPRRLGKAVQSPSPSPLSPPPPSAPGRRVGRRYIIFAALLLIVMIGTGIGAFLLLVRPFFLPSNSVIGRAFYVSSEILMGDGIKEEDARGIADRLQVDMQNVQPPPTGKSYYLWLLADKDTTHKSDLLRPPLIQPPILLTNNLPVKADGTVHWTYPGDAQHNNLLAATSRLLITLEDAGRMPASYSTDRSTWKYYAELPQAIIPNSPHKLTLRGLDHIRHIFYNEDNARVLARYGGLDIWVSRDTQKLLEWATAARDDFDPMHPTAKYGQMHDLFTSILDYLDGTSNVHVGVPPGTPVIPDRNIARISLLTVDSNRQIPTNFANDPFGDLDHLKVHVDELNLAPDATQDIHQLAEEISVAIFNASQWLTCARADAKQLFYMTLNLPPPSIATCQVAQSRAQCANQPAQDLDVCILPQSQSTTVCANQLTQDLNCLLDDLVTQITNAYLGQLDPVTYTITPGVRQAHNEAQQLDTFDITKNLPTSL